MLWDEAQKISGKDPDFHRRDLWDAIASGNFPEWELGVQIVEEKDEDKFDFDLLDATKLIPEELVPVQRVGRLTLDRNPDNFFAETEQVAFHVANLVPGIDVTEDPLMQGRLFSYLDTQLIRLGGPNFNEIPINRPLAPVHTLQRDGHMRQEINQGRVAYEPNSLGDGCPFQSAMKDGGFRTVPRALEGAKVRSVRGEKFFDHFSQARMFFISQSVPEQQHIVDAFQFELGKVTVPAIRERMVAILGLVHETLARRVGEGLGIQKLPKIEGAINLGFPAGVDPREWQPKKVNENVKPSPALSMANQPGEAVKTRQVAIVFAEGSDGAAIERMQKDLADAGAQGRLVGDRGTHRHHDRRAGRRVQRVHDELGAVRCGLRARRRSGGGRARPGATGHRLRVRSIQALQARRGHGCGGEALRSGGHHGRQAASQGRTGRESRGGRGAGQRCPGGSSGARTCGGARPGPAVGSRLEAAHSCLTGRLERRGRESCLRRTGMAEGEGFEPPKACARELSRLLPYQLG